MDRSRIIKIVVVLLAVWLVVSVVGAVVRGLFWLTVIGLVLFAGTAAYGYLARRSGGRPLR